MKFLLFAGIIAIFCEPLVFADNLSKVKLVEVNYLSSDEKYLSRVGTTLKIGKVNETFNRYITTYNVTRDWPCNTVFISTILRSEKGSNSKCSKFTELRNYTITLCNNRSNYFDSLAPQLVKLGNEGKCVPKGCYTTNSHNYFQFYNLLSDKELQKACFKVNNKFVTQTDVLFDIEFCYVSNDGKI